MTAHVLHVARRMSFRLVRQVWVIRDHRGWHLRLASQKNCRLICRVNGDEVAR